MKSKFSPDGSLGQSLEKWWDELQKSNGDKAELRRAQTVTDVILLPVYQRACQRFKPFFGEEDYQYRLAAILGLLAHVKINSSESLAKQMAVSRPGVSELRFRRLLQRDRSDLYITMIRVLRMLGNQANIYDLADSVYYWGDRIKREWAFEYFPNANTTEKTSA